MSIAIFRLISRIFSIWNILWVAKHNRIRFLYRAINLSMLRCGIVTHSIDHRIVIFHSLVRSKLLIRRLSNLISFSVLICGFSPFFIILIQYVSHFDIICKLGYVLHAWRRFYNLSSLRLIYNLNAVSITLLRYRLSLKRCIFRINKAMRSSSIRDLRYARSLSKRSAQLHASVI